MAQQADANARSIGGSTMGNQTVGESDAVQNAQESSAAIASSAADDQRLLTLEAQLKALLDELARMQNEQAGSHRAEVEDILAKLYPVEHALMTVPARSIAGLGVKARHTAHVVSEYWDKPIDQIDWHAKAVRLLIEAVCEVAGTPVPAIMLQN